MTTNRITKLKTALQRTAIVVVGIICLFAPATASARGYDNLSPEELERLGIYFAKGDYSCSNNSSPNAPAGGGGTANASLHLTAAQVDNAKKIIGVAKTYNLGTQGALIGLMVGITESHLRMYANTGVPISEKNPAWLQLPKGDRALGHDHDSVGVFQQRVSTGWSVNGNTPTQDVVWQLMDTVYGAQAFFGTPKGAKLPDGLKQPSALKKGLQNLDGWEKMDPWVAAQKVQISAYDGRPRKANNFSEVFGGNYKGNMDEAQQILNTYWASTPNVPIVISVSGLTAGTGQQTQNQYCQQSNTSSGDLSSVVATIFKFAWPNYCRSGSSSCPGYAKPTTKKPVYEEAVKRSKYKGDSCYGGGVDCGAFVTIVMRESGADPEYNKYNGNTYYQRKYLRDYADTNGGSHPVRYHRVRDNERLQTGDIAVKDGHTFIYVGKITGPNGEAFNGSSASSSQCERAPMAGPTDTRSDYEWYRLLKK